MADHDEWCAAVRQLQRWYGSSGEAARHITEVVTEIEREEGIPPEQAAPPVREATFRAWARDAQSTRNPRWKRARHDGRGEAAVFRRGGTAPPMWC